ncbi:MAG: SDR family NAD(P)-dependent oxidoreductase [Candidatus Binataceae bacterium]
MTGILEGKVALITGAGSGIGRATANIFAREGAKLALADIVEKGGQETLSMVSKAGPRRFLSRRTCRTRTCRGHGEQGGRGVRTARLRI